MQSKQKIILFDLDGTLIDSTQAIYESVCVAFRDFGFSIPTQEQVSVQIGYTLEDMFKSLGVEESLISDFVSAYKAHYRKICNEQTSLLKNAKEAILKAYEFAYLGVVTTKTGEYSKDLLKHFGVLEYFSCVIGRENVLHPKPHQEPILKALEVIKEVTFCNVAPCDIFMIGDTPLDILAAQNAKIQSLAVLSGYATKETLVKYTSKIYADSLEAVLSLVNEG